MYVLVPGRLLQLHLHCAKGATKANSLLYSNDSLSITHFFRNPLLRSSAPLWRLALAYYS